MSLRRLPEDAAERLAALEEFVRGLYTQRNVTPTDTRYLYQSPGDILVAASEFNPVAVHLPDTFPPAPGRWLLSARVGGSQRVGWAFVPDVGGGSVTISSGSGGGSGGTLPPVFGAPAITLGATASIGSIDEAIRRDARIVAFDGVAPSTIVFGAVAAVGVIDLSARRDHVHAAPADPTPALAAENMRERIRRLMLVA